MTFAAGSKAFRSVQECALNCFTHYMFYILRGPRDKARATAPVWTASGVID